MKGLSSSICLSERPVRTRVQFTLASPGDYLQQQPLNQVSTPAPSTWGEGGHMHVWLNENNHWIYQHLAQAQERMTELVERITEPSPAQETALKQAGRELLLAQSSDWAFILRTGTSPDYARKRVQDHLVRFNEIYEGLMAKAPTLPTPKAFGASIQAPEKLQIPSSKGKVASSSRPSPPEETRRFDSPTFQAWIEDVQSRDNLFPKIDFRYWSRGGAA